MQQQILITKAIKIAGSMSKIADDCNVSWQSVQKWSKNGLPLKCYSEEKDYHHVIERLTNGQITAADLLAAPRNSNQQ